MIDALEGRLRRGEVPVLRYVLGFASMQVGQWPRAWNFLQIAIASGDPCVNEHSDESRAAQDEALAEIRAHVALLAPECGARGARLAADGVDLGALPLPRPYAVGLGPIQIRVSAPGHMPDERIVTLSAGSWRERMTLVQLPVVVETTAHTSRLRPAGWVLIGTGAALAAAGAVFWALSYENAEEFEGYCDGLMGEAREDCSSVRPHVRQGNDGTIVAPSALCGAARGGTRLATLCGRNEALPMAAWAVGVTGAVALAAGVTTVLLAPTRQPAVTTSLWMQSGGAGLALRGAF